MNGKKHIIKLARSKNRINEFNEFWKFMLGDIADGQSVDRKDDGWDTLELPHDWSISQPYTPTSVGGQAYLPGGTG